MRPSFLHLIKSYSVDLPWHLQRRYYPISLVRVMSRLRSMHPFCFHTGTCILFVKPLSHCRHNPAHLEYTPQMPTSSALARGSIMTQAPTSILPTSVPPKERRRQQISSRLSKPISRPSTGRPVSACTFLEPYSFFPPTCWTLALSLKKGHHIIVFPNAHCADNSLSNCFVVVTLAVICCSRCTE